MRGERSMLSMVRERWCNKYKGLNTVITYASYTTLLCIIICVKMLSVHFSSLLYICDTIYDKPGGGGTIVLIRFKCNAPMIIA